MTWQSQTTNSVNSRVTNDMKTLFNEIFGRWHRKTASPSECAEGSPSEPAPPAAVSAADGSEHESKQGSVGASRGCGCGHSDTRELSPLDS